MQFVPFSDFADIIDLFSTMSSISDVVGIAKFSTESLFFDVTGREIID